MKKRLQILLVPVIILLLIASCNKDDDDSGNNKNQYADTLYNSAADADSAIKECYLKMYYPFAKDMQFIGYAISGNAKLESSDYNNLSYSSDNINIYRMYDYLYKGVFSCNEVIAGVPSIDMSAADIDLIVAEAYFLRGFYDFYRAILFNNPPVFTYDNQYDSTHFNSQDGELLRRAIGDFNKALPDLPASFSGTGIRNAAQGAADAYKGMCYLWLEDYDSARICFNAVIQSGLYDLVLPSGTDSADYFNAYMSNFTELPLNGYGGDNNIAAVFEIPYENDLDAWNFYVPGLGCRGNLLHKYFGHYVNSYKNVSAKFGADDVFETPGPSGMAADPRRAATFFYVGDTVEYDQSIIDANFSTTDPIYIISKSYMDPIGIRKYYYPLWYENSGHNNPYNWRLMRYAEVLLNFAEADFRANGSISGEGLEALNKIRRRVGMTEYTTVTSDDLVKERMRETMYEVNDALHLMRMSKTNSSSWVTMSDYNANFVSGRHEYLPIPDRVLEDYPNMTQNPGY